MKKQICTASLRKFSLLVMLMALFSCHRALAGVVYDNSDNPRPDPELFEQSGYKFGDEIVLSPAVGAYITNFAFEYWGNNFSGDERVTLRFYRNDGAAYGTNFNEPGSLIYDSGLSLVLAVTTGLSLNYDTANSGLAHWVPSHFTWTVEFTGVGVGESAGLALYTNIAVGGNYDQYWEASGPGNAWLYRAATNNLGDPIAINFGATVISSGATDTAVPKLIVNNVSKNAKFYSGLFTTNLTIGGTASDKISLALVMFRFGTGSFIPATTADGYTNWTATRLLQRGSTNFQAKSIDGAGNESVLYTSTFSLITTNPLTINIVQPSGTVNSETPALDGHLLEVGKAYTIAAVIEPTCLFSNWLSADFTNVNPKFTFTMNTNLIITANFVTNRFFAVQGSYNGLITNNTVSHANSGFITLKVKPKAGKATGFSGKVMLDGNSVSFGGTFNVDGTGVLKKGLPIKRKVNKPDLTMTLTLLFDGSQTIVGTVSDTNSSFASDFVMDRAVWTASNPATNYSGLYTMVMPGVVNTNVGPGGDGYATVSIDTNGVIKMAGKLGDGAAIKQKVIVSTNGDWPLFVNVYRDVNKEFQGSIMGWVGVAPNPTRGLSGSLKQIKQLAAGGTYYPAGYTNGALSILASAYNIPTNGALAINLNPISVTNGWGDVIMDGGGLPGDKFATGILSPAPKNKFSMTVTTNDMKLSVTAKTGKLKGSFIHLNPSVRLQTEGVILYEQNVGRGYFQGAGSESGTMLLQGH